MAWLRKGVFGVGDEGMAGDSRGWECEEEQLTNQHLFLEPGRPGVA